MKRNIENEFKILLTEEQYLNVTSNVRCEQNIKQTNYYYVDNDFLNIEKNITIRIRELPYGDKKLQIKLKKNNYSSLFVTKEEMEFDIQDISDSLDLSLYPELKKMGLGEVRYIGKLITDRLICKKEFCTLMIDKNHYLGYLDFELEIEFETQFESRAMAEIQKLGLNVDSNTLGKFKRFLDKYKE